VVDCRTRGSCSRGVAREPGDDGDTDAEAVVHADAVEHGSRIISFAGLEEERIEVTNNNASAVALRAMADKKEVS